MASKQTNESFKDVENDTIIPKTIDDIDCNIILNGKPIDCKMNKLFKIQFVSIYIT